MYSYSIYKRLFIRCVCCISIRYRIRCVCCFLIRKFRIEHAHCTKLVNPHLQYSRVHLPSIVAGILNRLEIRATAMKPCGFRAILQLGSKFWKCWTIVSTCQYHYY